MAVTLVHRYLWSSDDAQLSPDELRELFLFEELTAEQLDWVAANGDVVEVPPARRRHEGTGDLLLRAAVGRGPDDAGRRRRAWRSSVATTAGSYCGAVQFYIERRAAQIPGVGARGHRLEPSWPCRPRSSLRSSPSGSRWPCTCWRACCSASPQPAAGPAGAAAGPRQAVGGAHPRAEQPRRGGGPGDRRAARTVAGMRHKLALLADGRSGPAAAKARDVQEEFVKQVRHAPKLSALEASDLEDEMADWFEDHGIAGGWDLAAMFVAAGLGGDDMEAVARRARRPAGGRCAGSATRWRPRR